MIGIPHHRRRHHGVYVLVWLFHHQLSTLANRLHPHHLFTALDPAHATSSLIYPLYE
jgi:hypothetical protein